jgi:hypothetical protein
MHNVAAGWELQKQPTAKFLVINTILSLNNHVMLGQTEDNRYPAIKLNQINTRQQFTDTTKGMTCTGANVQNDKKL